MSEVDVAETIPEGTAQALPPSDDVSLRPGKFSDSQRLYLQPLPDSFDLRDQLKSAEELKLATAYTRINILTAHLLGQYAPNRYRRWKRGHPIDLPAQEVENGSIGLTVKRAKEDSPGYIKFISSSSDQANWTAWIFAYEFGHVLVTHDDMRTQLPVQQTSESITPQLMLGAANSYAKWQDYDPSSLDEGLRHRMRYSDLKDMLKAETYGRAECRRKAQWLGVLACPTLVE